MDPYIGVTGFTKPEEVTAALHAFPYHKNRKLMVGVLATWKSLHGIPMKPRWVNRTPDPGAVGDLFPSDGCVVNLVHFSTEEGKESSVLADLLDMGDIAGPNFHGFQLNIKWPEIRQIDDYRMIVGWDQRIVLQIGNGAIEAVGGTPKGVADMLYNYIGLIDDVLFDQSGGLGKPLDTERARRFLYAIAERGWDLGLGVAGGLSPDSLGLVEPLVAEFPDLSIDAEGQLRNPEDNLDLEAVRKYLTNASQLFA